MNVSSRPQRTAKFNSSKKMKREVKERRSKCGKKITISAKNAQ
ncbi:hypothetical protein HMPREF1024_04425 [Klebsiella sp. 4_1_44FAA]|nr:hypothetical protein HMPREF1024_04425 [Klebsiella sp. 4_1_44FAA]